MQHGPALHAQAKVEEQLKPLFQLLEDIQGRLGKGAKVPYFGTLNDWAEVRPPTTCHLAAPIAQIAVASICFVPFPWGLRADSASEHCMAITSKAALH
jgi:hypothetical protein